MNGSSGLIAFSNTLGAYAGHASRSSCQWVSQSSLESKALKWPEDNRAPTFEWKTSRSVKLDRQAAQRVKRNTARLRSMASKTMPQLGRGLAEVAGDQAVEAHGEHRQPHLAGERVRGHRLAAAGRAEQQELVAGMQPERREPVALAVLGDDPLEALADGSAIEKKRWSSPSAWLRMIALIWSAVAKGPRGSLNGRPPRQPRRRRPLPRRSARPRPGPASWNDRSLSSPRLTLERPREPWRCRRHLLV
jgi:hypothetical protein